MGKNVLCVGVELVLTCIVHILPCDSQPSLHSCLLSSLDMHSCLFLSSCVSYVIWLQRFVMAFLRGPPEYVATLLKKIPACIFTS